MEGKEQNKQIELKICNICGRECSRCRWFSNYYTLDLTKFNKTQYGWCCKFTDIVQAKNTCDLFERRPYSRKSKYSIRVYLSKLLTEITELHKVITAKCEEENELYKL